MQVVAVIRMAMYQIGQLQRRSGQDGQTSVELYWLDTARDVPALCEVLLHYLPKLQASPRTLLQVCDSKLLLCPPSLPCFLVQTQSSNHSFLKCAQTMFSWPLDDRSPPEGNSLPVD